MFLRSQFFFYKIYFDLLDRSNSLTFTWNPEKEGFEMKKPLVPKIVSCTSIFSHLIHFFAASYIFLILRLQGTETSTISIAFHFLGLTASCYGFLWRSLYVINARELISIMNTIILLEKFHFRSKQTYLNKSICSQQQNVILSLFSRNQILRQIYFASFKNNSNCSIGNNGTGSARYN